MVCYVPSNSNAINNISRKVFMKIICSIFLACSASFLAGCATTNSDREIELSAYVWLGSKLCADAGMLDEEVAAKGMAWASRQIYKSESPRLQAKAQEIYQNKPRPTQKDCNSLKLQIMALSQSNSNSPAAPSQSYMPKYTTCNKVFGQVNCTTY